MRKGTIKRPMTAKEPIIRMTGDAELYLVEDVQAIEIPRVPQDWDSVFDEMFGECDEVRGRRNRESCSQSSASDAPPPRQHPLPSQADTGAGADNRGAAIKVSDRLIEISDRVDRLIEISDGLIEISDGLKDRLSKICDDYAVECAYAQDDGEPEPALTEWERVELNRIADELNRIAAECESIVDDIQDFLSGEPELALTRDQLEWGLERDQLEWAWERDRDQLEWERDELNRIAAECESIVDDINDVLYSEVSREE